MKNNIYIYIIQLMNKRKNKGFTLAELLVVVAIIAVLVAISIPIFSSQLEKARQATDLANIRAAYAELMTAVVTEDTEVDNTKCSSESYIGCQLKSNPNVYYGLASGDNDFYHIVIDINKKQTGWLSEDMETSLENLFTEGIYDQADYNSDVKALIEYVTFGTDRDVESGLIIANSSDIVALFE